MSWFSWGSTIIQGKIEEKIESHDEGSPNGKVKVYDQDPFLSNEQIHTAVVSESDDDFKIVAAKGLTRKEIKEARAKYEEN